tara:strand:- start:2015 stop:2914 length:900 start_codon:yes stop_codon:yes gene_type:complete
MSALVVKAVVAQQIPDDSFTLQIDSPAFLSGEGPVVCIDEAHNNFHTVDGGYKAFANLLRSDGYVAIGLSENLESNHLSGCDVVVISNALAIENATDWSYPHHSAFNRPEILALTTWIDQGGNLLLIADHAPMAAAVSGLGAVLGILMADLYADGDGTNSNDIFSKSDNTLHLHSITEGRNSNEAIDSIVTFTGQPVQVTGDWSPLMTFGPSAIAFFNPQQTLPSFNQAQIRPFSIAGWTHGATREFGLGRIVFLGEAAMCTAQLAGPDQMKMGMNNPEAANNAQFCLNVVHWLTGIIN